MARQVLPWVGMAVGAYFGNPQLGFMIGSMVGNAVDPQVIKGPALGEGQNNSASEGGYRPIVLGKGAVGVCMIHEGPIKKRTIRTRQSKGGGPVTEEERAYRTMAFALGESAYPDTGVVLLRLWIDNKLRYDVTPTSQIVAESEEFADEFTFYPGKEDQLPDPDLESFMGAGNVPAYKGGSPYIVLPDWDVTSSQGRAPMIKAELANIVVDDGIAIAMAIGSDGTGSYTTSSDTGEVFDNVHVQGGSWLAALDGQRFFGFAGVGSWYTDDFGATKVTPSSPPPGTSGLQLGSYRNDVLLIPGGSDGGVWVSNDRGVSFTGAQVGEFLSWMVADTGDVAVSIFPGEGNCWLSTAPSRLSWAEGGDHGLDVAAVHACSSTPYHAIFGGTSQLSGGKPKVSWTSNGIDFQTAILSDSAGTLISALHGLAPTPTTKRWVAATNGGEIYVYDGSTWEKLPIEFNAVDIGYNGQIWLFAGTDENGDAAIMISEDLEVFGFAEHPYLGVVLQVDALPQPNILNAGKIPLHEIASFIHDRVDISPSKINVSQLTDMVEGVVFADGYTGADAMRAAMGWYQFDAGEFDAGAGYRINYIKRGGAAEATLTDSDVVEGPEEWEREDSYERPRVLHIAYQNPIADYGAPVIPIKRTSHDVKVVGERSVAIPFVTSDQDEVARRGDVALTVIYTEIAGTVEVILPISWLALAPTNTIGYSIRDRVRRLRMTDWKFSPDGTIKTEWIADRQSAFTSQLTALPPVPTTPPPPSIVGPTVSAVLDIPALVDSLDTLHLYAAATGVTDGWWGSIHQRRLPWETDYTTAATFTRPATIIGLLTDVVTDASTHFTDTTNVVRVTLYQDDELETFTQQQFLSENGAFALSWEDSGTRHWEVMQYRDAVRVGDRAWEMSTLARGRLNTETAEHPAGSLLVILDSSVRVMPMQSAWIGEDITHRAVSNGQLPDQAVPYTEEYTGESQREWPVASIEAELEGDTLNVSYVPRHRFGTDDHPVRSVNWSGYRVSATDGANTATVDTLADFHTFDVTDWATPITVSVSQLNRFTGPGPTVTESIPA